MFVCADEADIEPVEQHGAVCEGRLRGSVLGQDLLPSAPRCSLSCCLLCRSNSFLSDSIFRGGRSHPCASLHAEARRQREADTKQEPGQHHPGRQAPDPEQEPGPEPVRGVPARQV